MIYLTNYLLQTSTVISKRLIIKAETLKLIPFQVVEDELGGCIRRSADHWEPLELTVKIFSLARVRLETEQKLKGGGIGGWEERLQERDFPKHKQKCGSVE